VELLFDTVDSEIGKILLVSEGQALCALDFENYEARMTKFLKARYGEYSLKNSPDANGFSTKLKAYLAGDFASLEAIRVSVGGTPFQQQVWNALRTIPPGQYYTYGQLAAKVGRPTAYRAVGMTNSLNPVAIVLPCHRVLGANLALTGYAGGLERKRWLLRHEGVAL